MFRLIRVFETAMHDARRAEALRYDTNARRAVRADPESALLVYELRAGLIGDGAGQRRSRSERRERAFRPARGNAVAG